MTNPTLSDGSDTIELRFSDGEYDGPLAKPKRPTTSIPKKDGNPKQDLGRGNKFISGEINLTQGTELNGSNVGDAQTLADILEAWHDNATELTWTDENGDTLDVTLAIQSHTKTQVPSSWQRMSIELEEEVT